MLAGQTNVWFDVFFLKSVRYGEVIHMLVNWTLICVVLIINWLRKTWWKCSDSMSKCLSRNWIPWHDASKFGKVPLTDQFGKCKFYEYTWSWILKFLLCNNSLKLATNRIFYLCNKNEWINSRLTETLIDIRRQYELTIILIYVIIGI